MTKKEFLDRLEKIDEMALETVERHDRLIALIIEYLREHKVPAAGR